MKQMTSLLVLLSLILGLCAFPAAAEESAVPEYYETLSRLLEKVRSGKDGYTHKTVDELPELTGKITAVMYERGTTEIREVSLDAKCAFRRTEGAFTQYALPLSVLADSLEETDTLILIYSKTSSYCTYSDGSAGYSVTTCIAVIQGNVRYYYVVGTDYPPRTKMGRGNAYGDNLYNRAVIDIRNRLKQQGIE